MLLKEFWNVPNLLTFGRILVIPLFIELAYQASPLASLLAGALFAVAAITDVVDGWLARRMGLVTVIGKFLDPLADKLLVITVLVIMVSASVIPAWVALVVVSREFLITGLRLLAASQGVVIGSTPWGKSKTLTQNLMLMLLILQRPLPVLHGVAMAAVALAVTATVLSGLDYLWRYRRFVI